MSFLTHKLKCVTCGKDFEGKKIDSKNCSKECRVKSGHIKRKQVNDAKLAERLVPKPCKVCGDMFIPHKFKIEIQVYCGLVCQQKDMHKMRTEKPGYREQRREYAVKYRKVNHTEKRMKVMSQSHKVRYGGNYIPALERDNYTCTSCGETERKKLDVHHKDHSGSSDNPNNELDNLETLCRSCHMKHHSSEEYNIRSYRIPDEKVIEVIESSKTLKEAAGKLEVSEDWIYTWSSKKWNLLKPIHCPVCNTEFPNRKNRKFCSANCAYEDKVKKRKGGIIVY